MKVNTTVMADPNNSRLNRERTIPTISSATGNPADDEESQHISPILTSNVRVPLFPEACRILKIPGHNIGTELTDL